MTTGNADKSDHRGRRRSSKNPRIFGQFVTFPVEMLRSFAFRELSLSAHRVLARVAIEHCDHGGKENGKLPVTYGDFVEFGIDRHSVGPAIRECAALGFLEVTDIGFAGAGLRRPNRFRLTWLSANRQPPTNEWERVGTSASARQLASDARKPIPKKSSLTNGEKYPAPVWENAPKVA